MWFDRKKCSATGRTARKPAAARWGRRGPIRASWFDACNRDKNFTQAKIERRRKQLEESVARYLSQLDTADFRAGRYRREQRSKSRDLPGRGPRQRHR